MEKQTAWFYYYSSRVPLLPLQNFELQSRWSLYWVLFVALAKVPRTKIHFLAKNRAMSYTKLVVCPLVGGTLLGAFPKNMRSYLDKCLLGTCASDLIAICPSDIPDWTGVDWKASGWNQKGSGYPRGVTPSVNWQGAQHLKKIITPKNTWDSRKILIFHYGPDSIPTMVESLGDADPSHGGHPRSVMNTKKC